MPHVVILVYEGTGFEGRRYTLDHIADFWRRDGIKVTVLSGVDRFVEADLAILHVDLTVVPGEYARFARRYPVALNLGATDISKRRISTHLVRPGDGYDGPVIVKTDRNHGGQQEAWLASRGRRARRWVNALRDRLPWTCRARLASAEYPVFDSVRQVPGMVWHNRSLVVERFLPERDGEWYCLRMWTVLGDRETNTRCYSRQPIVKSANIDHREPVDEVPDELRDMRRELSLDYAKFDYALVDGRAVLYDVNPTPSLGSTTREQVAPRHEHLAQGLHAYL